MSCSHCGRCRQQSGSALSVSAALKQKRPWVLGALARACGMTEKEAAKELPCEMCVFAPGHAFEKIWKSISGWDSAIFVSQQGGFGVKYCGRIPEGRAVSGIYHFSGEGPLSGHVRLDSISEICFLSLPFMGRETCSVQFFDLDGSAMFAVHVGKVAGELSPYARASFMSMREKAEHDGFAVYGGFEIPMYKAV
ncbi:MAG: heme utilization cystosolic carrier protein HutX [Mailhella sp.]|nr:heme utilization cystosolic carrier protein HutX [Mailhella sp.]